MFKKQFLFLMMATFLGSPFSFAEPTRVASCIDFLKGKGQEISIYLRDVKDSRGLRLFFVNSPEQAPQPSWWHPFRTVGEYLVHRPVQAVSQRFFNVSKRPSALTMTAVFLVTLHFAHDVPADKLFYEEAAMTVAENSAKNEKEDFELLQDDLMYEGIKNLLDRQQIGREDALKAVYALRLNLINYAARAKDIDLRKDGLRLVTNFKQSLLFRQPNQMIEKYHLNEVESIEAFRLTHRYYFDYINLEIAIEKPGLMLDLAPSFVTNPYRQQILAAYQGSRMDRKAFRYLIEKDIELTYEYEMNSLIETARGVHLNPHRSLDSIRAGILRDLGL
jgi:hypothetical protein